MAENSKIEWCDHTANFWWGCLKVSPGCEHCYAETLSKRIGKNIWGPAATTDREKKKAIWKDIQEWDKKAWRDGVRRRVFVQSMSDFLEDHPQANEIRKEAIRVLENLKWLDVLLLTKRPENAERFLGDWFYGWPEHVWMGTSIETQKYADERIPELLKIPAKIRFLSCEPLLGPIDFDVLEEKGDEYGDGAVHWNMISGERWLRDGFEKDLPSKPAIHWVIAGGESGPKARPMHPDWVRSLRDQCQQAGAAFHFKQWGEFAPYIPREDPQGKQTVQHVRLDGLPYKPDDFSSVLQSMARVGKHAAGRLLDGSEWNEFPS